MSIKYRLDDLGWLDFEEMVQSLLTLQLGLGVESWGGSGDWGCDAYCESSLRYPQKKLSCGPFLFQCKFISGANAAGARTIPQLLKAVSCEVSRIEKRQIKPLRSQLPPPKHYAFISNAVIHPATRQGIKDRFGQVLGKCEIHIHDGNDVCKWLDLTPHLIMRFPQLFTIRDLTAFLGEILHSDILNRSSTGVAMAQEAAQIFVPTQAYFEALEKLRRFSFVVLEGPPEMGKTTIARIIALAQLTDNWEIIECKCPNEFHKCYRAEKKQVFVADDFFGRTEYEASRISRWNDELPFILRRINQAHWFILTSRAHLLQMAKSNLDISGFNSKFPTLGEVLVDAGKLSRLEKAKILYRHCKAASLTEKDRTAIKAHALPIIDHKHFTPLRISRLIRALAEKIP